eukprot:ANDGO_02210.mRNA.1 putative prefoldin subunit 4
MASKVLAPATATSTTTATVLKEDQMRINTFSRLNNRRHELEDDIAALDAELLRIKDAQTEIWGSDEIRVQMAESYASVEADEAERFLETRETAVKHQVSLKKNELQVVTARMKQLKATLYAKFGKSINLEEDSAS